MLISEYKEDKPNKHWGLITQPLDLYKYTDVFDDTFYQKLKTAVISRVSNKTTDLTYQTHRTSFMFDDRKLHIVSHKQNDRVQDVVFDLTFIKEYWYQTNDTIYDWAWNHVSKNIHPLFYKFLDTFKNVRPFTDEPNCYIPFRWHLNYLDYTEYLNIHADSNHQYFNTKCAPFARAKSLTFYLHDNTPGWGGELYFLSGYIHRPKENEGVLMNGNASIHGINSNMNPNKKPRLAFTTRWAHKDDLYLPGDPSKAMYQIDLL